MASLKKNIGKVVRSILRYTRLWALHAIRLAKGAKTIDGVFMPKIALSYKLYLKNRDGKTPRDFSAVSDSGRAGLVSVVLPVYNGKAYLAEAIESVLAQSYTKIELIIVDDGSTDSSLKIMESYARKDTRITVIAQPNLKLPEALNTGFRNAKGQYLTWTSHDNRFKPDCLEKMVNFLDNQIHVDMVYANYEIIGEEGKRFENAPFCAELQDPPDSGIIRLPEDVSVIQYVNGNFIGPAFLYRRRVLDLIGDYSSHWFTCEDYDYFLRVNEHLILRRLDYPDSIYEYRVHRASLSADGEALGINEKTEALMAFDDHRRDAAIGPVAWSLSLSAGSLSISRYAKSFESLIERVGDCFIGNQSPNEFETVSRVYIHVIDKVALASDAPQCDKASFDTRVLICVEALVLPDDVHPDWDLCLTNANDNRPLPSLDGHRRGWLAIPDAAQCMHAIRVRAQSDKMAFDEQVAYAPVPSAIALSVIVCTCRGARQLAPLLNSLNRQTLPSDQYELLIVNNDPANHDSADLNTMAQGGDANGCAQILLIPCSPAGLSRARNAGLMHARGDVVLFLDDDTIADSRLLEEILKPYRQDEEIGLVGGVIDLELPDSPPSWMGENLWPYWSHFHPEGDRISYLDDWKTFPYGANWSARRLALLGVGGFRCTYGRNGTLVDSGEETVAAILMQKINYKVATTPDARVVHKVNPKRFSLINLIKIIQGGYAVMAQMEMDYYIEHQLSMLGLLVHSVKRLAKAFSPTVSERSKRILDLFIMVSCFRCALKLAYMQILRLGKY